MKSRVSLIEHQSEVEKYLAMMDIVVVASQGPEALPQTIIEAMSMGKAVIAQLRGIVEVLETERQDCLKERTEQIGATMLKLLHNRTSVNPQHCRREFTYNS
jgi:glycosyltransferase involved in cell wall biosynthesis